MFRYSFASILGLLLLAAASGLRGTGAAPLPPLPLPPAWERLLAWLPEDTETLIVSQEPFEIPESIDEGKLKEVNYSRYFQFIPALPFMSFRDGQLIKELHGLKVQCVVEGSRHFTRPGEFGLMPYRGCHIFEFAPGSDNALKKAFKTLLDQAKEKIQLDGESVAVFLENQGNDDWKYFVCLPRPGILIIATDRECLRITLGRIGRKAKQQALPSDLLEWKHVDVKASVWAIRHFRKEFAKIDPTSPFNGASDNADRSAIGFVFWVAAGKDRAPHARYLTTAKNAEKRVEKSWGAAKSAKFREIEPGIIEITAETDNRDEASLMFLLVLMLQLGHGIVF